MRKLLHHSLATIEDRYTVEVWADDPDKATEARAVVLYVSDANETAYVHLTPTEARALAALLTAAAAQQERP